MKKYDPTKPIISIHIPKTAGTTFKDVVLPNWNLQVLKHYDLHGTKKFHKMPYIDLQELKNADSRSILIHGHFFPGRNGIAEYYPNIDQFISILRDPLDMFVSLYYYCFRLECAVPECTLDQWIESNTIHYLNYFYHKPMTLDNYQDIIENDFVEIGVSEKMEQTIQRFSSALNMPFDVEWLNTKLNVGCYDKKLLTEEQIARFKDKHKLEYAIYNYVLNKFE
jgi:hypothetical protein